MLKFLTDSIDTYLEAWRLLLVLGFIVFAILLFLTQFSTYVVAGAGFVRYSSLLNLDFDLVSMALLLVVSLLGLFCIAFLSVGATMVVKLRRSLDDHELFKFVTLFPRYLMRLTVWWIVLGAITFIVMLVSNALKAPSWISALLMLFIWAFFIFIPQSLVLKEKKFSSALKDSASYCMKKPLAVLFYYALSCFLLFMLVLVDVLLGQFFLSWLAAIINSALLFIVFIPLLEIIKANLFVSRYKLLTLGLK